MRYPSLTVAFVLCAHLGASPFSLDATSPGGGAPAKIGVVNAAAAFVVPSSRHRNSLPIQPSSLYKSPAFGPDGQQQPELSPILSPASSKRSATRLPSSIIDAPRTLSTSQGDDDDDEPEPSNEFDSKLEADAEAFFEQMMARRSSIMQGAETEEPGAVLEEEEEEEEEEKDMPDISEEVAPDVAVIESSSSDVKGSPDEVEGKSDEDIAEEWHNDQMANALASVQSMNGQAALESIAQEESRVHFEKWEQREAEKQEVFKAGYVGSVAKDDYAFQRSRLERQLIQPRFENNVSGEVSEEVAAESVIDMKTKSASETFAFQQARLQRQLAQPTQLTPHPPSLRRDSDLPPSSDEKVTTKISSNDASDRSTAFQQARLARQLPQHQAKTTDISSSPNDAPPKAKEVLEAPVVEISEEDIKARRAYYKRIEALSAEVVRKASEAADRVLEERRQMECETLSTIEEAVELSAQSESTEISADIHANEDNENDSYVVAPIQVPETMIDTARWDVEMDAVVDKLSPPSSQEESPTQMKKPSRRSTTAVIEKNGSDDIHSQAPQPNNGSAQSILATVLPERSLTDLSDEAEMDIARYAAIHLTHAAFDTTRAAAFTLGAVFDAFRDPVTDSTQSKEKKSDESSALDSVERVSNNALSFLDAISKSNASKQAIEAAGSAAHQYSSFLAACGALGLRAGVKAKVYAEDYKQQQIEARRRIEEAKAEEKRQMLAKIAKIAEEKRLEEERIAAEKDRMEMIRKQEEERIATEKKALAELKARIEMEKKRVEEERIAAEQRAIEDIRRKAEEKQRSLDMELEKNGLAEKKIVEIKGSRKEKPIASLKPSPLFFVEQEKAAPFFFVDE